MITTKLILVEGMTGSGKSRTAHWLARQLARNGIKARWLHEEEPDHPLRLDKPSGVTDASGDREKKEAFMRGYPACWESFAVEAQAFGGVTIVESCLFQYALIPLVRSEFPREAIKSFAHALVDRVRRLDPVLVSFRQDDVPEALRLNWSRRGDAWRTWYIERLGKSDYAMSRGMDGEKAAYELWKTHAIIAGELSEELGIPRIVIENSRQDWAAYYGSILSFLGIKGYPETLFEAGSENYCGRYSGRDDDGEDHDYRVHISDGRLCLDAFWPGLALLPREAKGEFEIDGFPFSIRFNCPDGGLAESLEVIDASFYYKKGFLLRRGTVPVE